MTEDIAAAVSLSTELRSAGVRTQLYSEQKKFKAKITYASKLGIPFALFLGDDEIAEGTVSVKDLSTGEQVKLPVDDAAQFILNALSQRGGAALIRQ
jgi:histidyl-tRNA synthetase